jgi:DNA-directed RNA polymerase beta' subunit
MRYTKVFKSKTGKSEVYTDADDDADADDDDSVIGESCREKKSDLTVEMSVIDIYKIFDNILDSDVSLIGIDPTRMHPRNMILTVFPVIPTCARPWVIADGNLCDDDLTNQIIEIVKINNLVEVSSGAKRHKALQTLKFRILTFYNNSNGKSKHPTNGRPIKGIKERITGKSGQIRGTIMGKRCEFTGRTVIGPDPTLKLGQIALPKLMADTLTYPENVYRLNLGKIQEMVDRGDVKFIIRHNAEGQRMVLNMKYATLKKGSDLKCGDIVLRPCGPPSDPTSDYKELLYKNRNIVLKSGDRVIRNGVEIEASADTKRHFKVQIGDVAERVLRTGDVVLLNRQPTLHQGSMLAKEVVVRNNSIKTIRMNLATTKPFNADFDMLLCRKQEA